MAERWRVRESGVANLAEPTEALSTTRYRLLRPLGRGGFSAVYLARDEELNRDVALKVMRGRYKRDPWASSRLVFEAEVTAGLEHPGVVPVYRVGRTDKGRAYFTMRYIDGQTLSQAARGYHEGTPTRQRSRVLRRLIDRLVDVCYTVAFAHEKGIAHRDLTPSNIMLGRHGETLVVDWGLARRLDHTGPDDPPPAWPRTARKLVGTRMGENVGTPRYMSPEQAVGAWDHFGPATDVFGLGAALYRVLVGRPPFDDPDDQVCREKAYRVDCPRPRQVDRSIPAALEAICLKAMMGDPEQRYASPLDLGRDLSRWVEHQPLSIPRAATVRAWEQQRVDEPS